MTKRDFFRLIIKLFGLYSLILTVFTWIPSNLPFLTYGFELTPILLVLGLALLSLLIFYVLIIKTDAIINFLKLDKGFDDPNITIGSIGTDKILMLGIILIGGLLLIHSMADLILYSCLAFKKEVQKEGFEGILNDTFGTTADYINWAFSAINTVLGYVLLTNYNKVANWLHKQDPVKD